jgi:hypothetical protein
MALTVADKFEAGALNGATATLNTGSTDATGDFRLLTAADVELALLTFSATAFQAASSSGGLASALSNTITKDTSITAGTIAKFQLRDRDNVTMLAGSVGLTGSDLNVSDNVIPPTATEVTCTAGLTLTLQLS